MSTRAVLGTISQVGEVGGDGAGEVVQGPGLGGRLALGLKPLLLPAASTAAAAAAAAAAASAPQG